MRTFGWLDDNVMAGPVTWAYWRGEVNELLEEVRAWRWGGIREEWSDVACLFVLALMASRWPVRWVPVLPGLGLYAAKKFERRLATWKLIFKHHGVPFERKFLRDGGNFRKLAKVRTALHHAGYGGIDEAWLRREDICTE